MKLLYSTGGNTKNAERKESRANESSKNGVTRSEENANDEEHENIESDRHVQSS